MCPISCLCSHEAVLNNKMQHVTLPENREKILAEGKIRGSFPESSSGRYDGPLASSNDAPPCVFLSVEPESEVIHFPFSNYPVGAEPSDEVASILIDMSVLLGPAYRMYFCSSTPSQFGPNFSTRVHTQVVFARDEEHIRWADENLVPLDKFSNRVMCFKRDGSGRVVDCMLPVVIGVRMASVRISFFFVWCNRFDFELSKQAMWGEIVVRSMAGCFQFRSACSQVCHNTYCECSIF